ncbi:DUF3426 domain-containing protein [Lysobacter arenosi]|uniref:DUF3426 domain-containing protein n=1 Tax=Lysobacter arenosi TaxID=2795387 RepID=A0ABX7R9F8_9GAMM|nr:DUF3426 domain-containing protein [Lysobacter arenosi]QSX74768.1 DUF3426 domain-containing protein [Lysobacter arenosi]
MVESPDVIADEVIATDDAPAVECADVASPTTATPSQESTELLQADAVVAQPAAGAPAADAPAADTTESEPATPTFEQAIEAAAIRPAAPRRQRRGARPRRKGEPSFASRDRAADNARLHWRWYAALAGLVLLLGLQLLLAQRRELAADARWRPYVSALCTVAGCDVPPWHEPAAFTMIQRNVRAKPGSAGVLAVEASFRNDAHWPQPWPTLLLGLSDVDGRLAGQRAFTPGEYRPGQKATDVLLPGQSATVTLDVIEPAPRIVAFTFDFR